MQTEIIASYDAFADLEAKWNWLYQVDPDAQLFLSWTWLSKVFQKHPNQWCVLAVKNGASSGDYAGLFPLRLKTIWSKSNQKFRNEIHMAGRLDWAQYTGFLCHPDWENEVIVALANGIKQMHWSRISLKYFHTSDFRLKLFLDQFPSKTFKTKHHRLEINNGTTNNLTCPYIILPEDYETYLQTQLSSNTRQKIRRFSRQFESSDDLRITIADAETIQRDLDITVDLWIEKWTDSKGERAEELARTYRRILWNGFECGSLHLPILWQGPTPLGSLGHLIDWKKRRLFFIIATRNESKPEPFVGWMLHAHSIRWSVDNGIKIYDFCHGDEAYKYSYGAKDLHVKYASISTRSGVNLNGIIDPSSIDDVMLKTIRFIKTDRLEEAHIACQQVHAAAQLAKGQPRLLRFNM